MDSRWHRNGRCRRNGRRRRPGDDRFGCHDLEGLLRPYLDAPEPHDHVDVLRRPLHHRHHHVQHQPVTRLRHEGERSVHRPAVHGHPPVPQQFRMGEVRPGQLDPDRLPGPRLPVAARVHTGDPVGAGGRTAGRRPELYARGGMQPMEVQQPAQNGVRGTPLAGVGPPRERGELPRRRLPAAALPLYGQTGGGQPAQQPPLHVRRLPGDRLQDPAALGGRAEPVVDAGRVRDAVGVRRVGAGGQPGRTLQSPAARRR